MGDGSMTTLTIADPEKEGIGDYLKSLPSRHIKAILLWLDFNRNLFRNPEGVSQGPIPGIGTGYHQNGVEYPSPYDFSIYTDYLKVDIAVRISVTNGSNFMISRLFNSVFRPLLALHQMLLSIN